MVFEERMEMGETIKESRDQKITYKHDHSSFFSALRNWFMGSEKMIIMY